MQNNTDERTNKCVWAHKKLKKLHALLNRLRHETPKSFETEMDIQCIKLEIVFWKKYLKKHT